MLAILADARMRSGVAFLHLILLKVSIALHCKSVNGFLSWPLLYIGVLLFIPMLIYRYGFPPQIISYENSVSILVGTFGYKYHTSYIMSKVGSLEDTNVANIAPCTALMVWTLFF